MAEPEVHVDYRFLLANERTFLAWMRTALGLIAGGVALDQFVRPQDGSSAVVVVALATIATGALLAIVGTVRWSRTDSAMRAGTPVARSRTLVVIGVLLALLALVVAGILLVS
jgi:inner membrane protein YidH